MFTQLLIIAFCVCSPSLPPSLHFFSFPPTAPIIPVRLSNGREGKVEVFFGGQWGSVCSDGWSENNTKVVCNQLNSSESADSLPRDAPVWLSGVECQGNETALSQCSHRGWGTVPPTSTCHHDSTFATISCDPGTPSVTIEYNK